MKWTLILTFVSLPALCCSSSGCSSPSLMSTAMGCLCPGNDLQLWCSVTGGVNTVWTGSAITDQCDGNSITLRHSGFSGTVRLSCNSEAVIGQNLPLLSNVSANCYTSQLLISITDDLNGTDIRCQIDNNTQPFPEVGQYIINLTKEPYSAPYNVQLIGIASKGLTFNWTSIDTTCSDVSYRISASGCGNCPSSTSSTTITCSGIEQLFEDNQTCILSIRSVVCGDIVSNFSDPLNVSLQVTNLPRATILPRYWQNTTSLTGFVVEITIDPIAISGISVMVKSYQVEYFNSITGNFCGPITTLNLMNESTCVFNGICKIQRDLILPESCGNDDVDVTISATTVLGTGPPTQSSRIDGTNKFVNITFDSVTNKFHCNFLNQDTSGKSCNVSYALCGDHPLQTEVGFTNTERPNCVEIQLSPPESRLNTYCYIIAASNDTFKILIEGRFATRRGVEVDMDGLKPGSIVGIVLGVIFFLILCIGGILLLIAAYITKCMSAMHKVTAHDQRHSDTENSTSGPTQIESIQCHATENVGEKDTDVPSNDGTMEVEGSDHNQKLATADHMSQPVDTTLSAHVTTDDSEHKNGTDQDQSSNKVLMISSVDPDKGDNYGESTDVDNKSRESTDADNSKESTNTMLVREQPPEWVPDSNASNCMRCDTMFTVTFRKHHCRHCGYVVCSKCSKEKSILPWEPSKPVRVCSVCHEALSATNDGKNN